MESNELSVSSLEHQINLEIETKEINYSKRAKWLRAALFGAIDGLVSTASIMMGVGAVKQDIKTMILTGLVGLISGAFSMAIGEYVSVYSQSDIELAQKKRQKLQSNLETQVYDNKGEEKLSSPLQAAVASFFAFLLGAMVPLLAASFIRDYTVRLEVVVAAVTLALGLFGWLGGVLGKASPIKPAIRVLVGGWLAMAITFGLTKLIYVLLHKIYHHI